jgi:DNA/RNA endonuclease G (NUC1)/membrane protein DedA with SNARE-associated domain
VRIAETTPCTESSPDAREDDTGRAPTRCIPVGCLQDLMIDDALAALASSPAALPLLFALVLGDAFLVVLPGEAAVTAYAAISVSQGVPPLVAVIGIAAAAAVTGDLVCYGVGRRVGLERWAWMRRPRVATTFEWARLRLERSTASVLFSARFIPFARLAVNLTAGAGRMRFSRYVLFAGGAGVLWAIYQAFIGVVVAQLIPGAPLVAVIISIVIALAVGALLDVVLTRRWGAPRGPKPAPDVAPGEDAEAMDENASAPSAPAAAAAARTPGIGPGYDAAFLGAEVVLPTAPGRATTVLPYLHFSVVVDRDRRLACVTGVNIDGAALRDIPRTGDWSLDSRLRDDEQAGPAVYARNDLDRGHLVRRRDPGWGDAATARTATTQTFSYPNAAPQASRFNQSAELWLGLEDHVLAYAEAERSRISVFTAPVLSDDDPPYRGIRVPRRFWKIAVWATGADAAPLASAGFVLDQSDLIDATVEQGVVAAPLGGFRTFQAPIADIERISGIDAGVLADVDVLQPVPAVRADAWAELTAASDIRLAPARLR